MVSLIAVFPKADPHCRASPLQPQFGRVLQIGDASGIQSPLSFGGFGALSRHLPRLTCAIADALKVLCLSAPCLKAPKALAF